MRFLSLFIVVLSVILLTGSQSGASDPMIIAGSSQGPPISWEKNGTLTGVAPELASKILTDLKIPFVIRDEGNWQEVQNKAQAGKIDMIVSAYDNKKRRMYMEYSIPYLKSPVIIVVKKDAVFPFSSWNSLIGKKGVAHSGESFGQEFDSFIQTKLNVSYLSYERAFQMLNTETADYLIIDLYPAIVYSQLLNAEEKVSFLDTPVTIQNFHMTISKKSPYLNMLPAINKKIKALLDQGYIKKLTVEQYKKWHKTFQERQRFFAKQNIRATREQTEFNAGARDRGLERLARFVERDLPYMEGNNFTQ